MEFASSYLPTEHDPCFYIEYYSTDRELTDKNHFGHQYGGFYCDYIYLSGIHLPIIKSHDYKVKYEALYLTLKYSDGWKSEEEEYLADIVGLAENLQVNKSWEVSEGLVCFEYTHQAIESLKKLYDFEIESMPEPPNEFSKEPSIFFLYQNSD